MYTLIKIFLIVAMIIAVLCVAIVIRDIVVEEMDRSAARKAK